MGSEGFTYRSDYDLEIYTPLMFCRQDFRLRLTSESAAPTTIVAPCETWSGGGTFSLPATRGRQVKVKFEQ